MRVFYRFGPSRFAADRPVEYVHVPFAKYVVPFVLPRRYTYCRTKHGCGICRFGRSSGQPLRKRTMGARAIATRPPALPGPVHTQRTTTYETRGSTADRYTRGLWPEPRRPLDSCAERHRGNECTKSCHISRDRTSNPPRTLRNGHNKAIHRSLRVPCNAGARHCSRPLGRNLHPILDSKAWGFRLLVIPVGGKP